MNRIDRSTEPVGKIRSSITNRLQTKMFFRLIGIFIAVNLIICVIAATALAFHSENRIVYAMELIIVQGSPEDEIWMDFAGVNVRALPELSIEGSTVWPFTRFLSFDAENTVRGFRAQSGSFLETVSTITYVVGVSTDNGAYEIELHIGAFLLYFILGMFVLMLTELLVLLSATVDDRRMIRKTLDPISEFARAAQNFSEINRQLDHEKMMTLAGRLDGIDAGHLDSRIQLDDLHEELRNVGEAINGMLDRINESYAAQARFVSDASHELRTPIAVIQGYANLLDRWGKEDEKTLTESIAAIKDEA